MITKFPSIEDMSRYVGENVLIEWINPAHDWPSFHVLGIDAEQGTCQLRGIADPKGHPHKGDVLTVDVDDIVRIESFTPKRAKVIPKAPRS